MIKNCSSFLFFSLGLYTQNHTPQLNQKLIFNDIVALLDGARVAPLRIDQNNMPSHEEGIGYGRLASTLALDNDLCIFRHFAKLNIRNILYLQSELQELELKLQQLDVEANNNINEPSKWSKPRSYHYASRTKATALDENDAYWDTVLRIRDVLERYSMFILSRIVDETDPVRYNYPPC